jgi:multidrug efflux pump subunit AcrB
MLAKLKSLNGLQDVASDQRTGSPQLMIDIDCDAASRLGANVTTIEQTLYDAFGQPFVTQLYAPLKTYPQYQQDVSALSRLYVHGAAGKMIPISQFAALNRCRASSRSIIRDNSRRRRCLSISELGNAVAMLRPATFTSGDARSNSAVCEGLRVVDAARFGLKY